MDGKDYSLTGGDQLHKYLHDHIEQEIRDYPKNLDTIINGDLIKQLITCRRLGVMCETCQAILKVHDSLTEAGKQIVQLHYWDTDKLTDAEIAAQLNITAPQVKKYRKAICEAIAKELGYI